VAELSPAAQSIWDAFNAAAESVGTFDDYGYAIAAALSAATYHTIRPDPLTGIDCIIYAQDILAIAAELEAR
jgi:hypothetical protein